MKKMVIGLIIGLTIGYAASAYAAVGDTVSAVFANFSYMVNGTSKAIDAPVLVYEGTSYVRTTDIGNMLGFDVTYKSDSRTIAFSNGTQTPISTPSPSPITQPVTVTSDAYGVTPAPTVNVTPAPSNDPIATPSPSVEPTASPDPSASPTPSVTPAPSPTPTATPAPTVSPTPTPNYSGYNAAVSRLEADAVAKKNQLYADWYNTYKNYPGSVTAQAAYDSMTWNSLNVNTQLELDKQALKAQYNIP